MRKIFIVDNSVRDTQRFSDLLALENLAVEVSVSGEQAQKLLRENSQGFEAAFILWDLPGKVSGYDLMVICRQRWPEMPIVMMCSALDAAMATQASALGAKDFLEKPLESERIRSCVRSLFEKPPPSPLVMELQKNIVGESVSLLEMLSEVAKAIRKNSRILLIGESGTGKELIAQAIHQLGAKSSEPWIAVNISAVPSTLIESALFGHEKGAFTGATDRHKGFLEEAGNGTIFLDEIGDLELSIQVKLLRVMQEKVFRRLRGTQDIPFEARVICATNRNLAASVNSGTFRRDLFHRIAELTIQLPPLRERKGDLDVLLKHFTKQYGGNRSVIFARETLAILRSYPFLGNVRELDNIVRSALIKAQDQDIILPHHLPLPEMGILLAANDVSSPEAPNSHHSNREVNPELEELIQELSSLMPAKWLKLPYREASNSYIQAFDRVYLKHRLQKKNYNITQAAKESEIDVKTFRKRWKECGLPSLDTAEDDKESPE
jgi:DNA-binding NtrC family response regulator